MNLRDLSVRLATSDDEASWNEFVTRHPQGSLSHRFEWKRVVETAYRKRTYYLVAQDRDGWQGALPLVHMPSRLAGNRLVSLPFLDQGGTLAGSSEAAAALWRETLDLAARLRVRGLDLRGGGGEVIEPRDPDRLQLLLRLGDSSEELWNKISGKVRNLVRKSEKRQMETRRLGADSLPSFYEVFGRNMRDLGSPVHSRRFFEEIFAAFGDRAALFVTFGGETPVAGGVALRFRDTVTVPWASSLRSARADCPNYSLYWEILQDAVEQGAAVFDFGRSAPGSGTLHFKKQWGAEARPLDWSSYGPKGDFEQPRQLDARSRPLLADLWRRLPVWLANRLGPPIRGNLPN